jgi:hypothetical protein
MLEPQGLALSLQRGRPLPTLLVKALHEASRAVCSWHVNDCSPSLPCPSGATSQLNHDDQLALTLTSPAPPLPSHWPICKLATNNPVRLVELYSLN